MIEITWIGHSTFQLRAESGETLLLDPWLDNPKRPAGYAPDRVDGILVSHGHFDHIASVVELGKKFDAPVVAIYEIATWLGQKGLEKVVGMNKGGSVDLGTFRATMTHAFHSSSIQDGDQVLYGGEAAGYIIGLPDGRNAYFAGDTAVFGDMRLIGELYRPEIAFLPIGDLYTMGPKEAAMACRLLQPKIVIPMHWGTFPPLTGTPEALMALIQDLPGTQVLRMEPGETTKL